MLIFTLFLYPPNFCQSVQFSHWVLSNSLWPHGLQHTRPPCPSPTSGVYPNSCPLSQWCHPTISSSVVPFSSCLQSFPASGFFPMGQFFTSGGQSIGISASASVLPMNIQDWFPLGWTGIVHGVTKSRTEWLWLHFHFSLSCIGEGNGNPPQCSFLENPRDVGAWWAAVSGIAQSLTRLKRFSSSSSSI